MLLPKKSPGIRLSFEYITTLLSGEGGEGRTGTAMMFRKMLSKYTIFSTVLSKIVAVFMKSVAIIIRIFLLIGELPHAANRRYIDERKLL